MAMIVTNDCINCGACVVECQTEAICGPGSSLKINGGKLTPLTFDHFFIIVNKCNECLDFNYIKCISICPMDAIRKI